MKHFLSRIILTTACVFTAACTPTLSQPQQSNTVEHIIHHGTRDSASDPMMTLYIFPENTNVFAGKEHNSGRTIQFPLREENLYKLNTPH